MFLNCPNPTGSFCTFVLGEIFIWKINLKHFQVAEFFHLLQFPLLFLKLSSLYIYTVCIVMSVAYESKIHG